MGSTERGRLQLSTGADPRFSVDPQFVLPASEPWTRSRPSEKLLHTRQKSAPEITRWYKRCRPPKIEAVSASTVVHHCFHGYPICPRPRTCERLLDFNFSIGLGSNVEPLLDKKLAAEVQCYTEHQAKPDNSRVPLVTSRRADPPSLRPSGSQEHIRSPPSFSFKERVANREIGVSSFPHIRPSIPSSDLDGCSIVLTRRRYTPLAGRGHSQTDLPCATAGFALTLRERAALAITFFRAANRQIVTLAGPTSASHNCRGFSLTLKGKT